MRKYLLILASTVLAVSAISAQETNPALSSKEQLAESVNLAPCDGKERLSAVKKMFAEAGAKEEDIEVEKFKGDISNVVLKLKGKTDEKIIVGAHYDKTTSGCGAIDNWSGVSVLVQLYKTLKHFSTEKTYIFAAFDQEEKGLLGSEAMAKAIPKEQLGNYCLMTNIDSFRQGITQSIYNISSPKVSKYAKDFARETDIQFAEISINGSSDSVSFRRRGIPSITFSGLDGDWTKYLHSGSDKAEAVNPDSVYIGYRFVLSFLAKADGEKCSVFR